MEGIDYVITDNSANKHLDFYYYIPEVAFEEKLRDYPVFACIPWVSGRGEEFVNREMKEFARREEMIIISPSFVFDEENFHEGLSYQFPAAWSGEAFLKILKRFRGQYNIRTAKIYFYGFSAGAQFSLRFALWRPEMVAAAAVHAPGMLIVPQEYVPVKFYLSVGKDDTQRLENVEAFCQRARILGIDVSCHLFPGGHEVNTEEGREALRFISSVKNAVHAGTGKIF